MKCIRCGRDSRLKERSSGKCPGCRGQFAFERGELFTDAAFASAIEAVSGGRSLRWGIEHLYYELNRRRRDKPLSWGCLAVPVVLALFLLPAAVFFPDVPGPGRAAMLAVGAGCALVVGLGRFWNAPTVKLDQPTFDRLWRRWLAVHSQPAGVIIRPERPKQARPREPDLGDYSFDRAVLCDRARTVDLLLANRFHFENNCAVLSMGGYPPGPFETVRAMLRRNSRLEVYALHDATPEGCRMAHILATSPLWFKGTAEVIDVGLRPGNDGHAFRGLRLAAGGSVEPGPGITEEEARWLSRFTLELAAIRPEQVLKRLYRAITQKEDARRQPPESVGRSEDDVVSYDESSFSSDASDVEGGADGFG